MKEYLSFIDAKKYVKSLNLKSVGDWKSFCKSVDFPKNIPTNPNREYLEWISYPDFLGYNYKYRKNSVNESFFDEWTHDSAYVFGLWFADGCISNHYEFIISLHSRDADILKSIKEAMHFEGSIKKRKNLSELRICSKRITNKIKKLGGKEKKSLDCIFPYVPKSFLPDFIRGVFDGDGSIYKTYKNTYGSSFTSGSKDFIYGLHNKIKESIEGIGGNIYESNRGEIIIKCVKYNTCPIYGLKFSTNDTIRLGNFMYGNGGIMMKRKHIRFCMAGKTLRSRNPIKNVWDFETAKAFAKATGAKSKRELFKIYAKSGKPIEMPYNPNITYCNSGWRGWKNFLNGEK